MAKMCSNPIQSVVTALTGRIKGEGKWGSQPHLKQLIQDLQHLQQQGGPKITANIASNGKPTADLSKSGHISMLTKSQTNKALCFESRCESRQLKMAEPPGEAMHVCDFVGCVENFKTFHRLQTHRVRTHGYRDTYRRLIVDATCPMCGTKLASKVGAMNHIQKVCGTKGTEEERSEKVRIILINQRLARGEITELQAAFMRNQTDS